jgi:hypothetical protein
VHRYWDHPTYSPPVVGHQSTSTLLPYWDYLTQRWQAGSYNRQQRYQELQQFYQYCGSSSSVQRAVQHLINQTGIVPQSF